MYYGMAALCIVYYTVLFIIQYCICIVYCTTLALTSSSALLARVEHQRWKTNGKYCWSRHTSSKLVVAHVQPES